MKIYAQSGLPFGPSQIEAAFMDRVRAFAPGMASGAAQTAVRGRLDEEVLRGLTEIGAFRAHVPAELGGLQLPYATLPAVGIVSPKFGGKLRLPGCPARRLTSPSGCDIC